MALVLCTGVDPALMRTRQLILEKAGHEVIPVLDERNVEKECERHKFDVVVISQNATAKVKARILQLVRDRCPSAKILELHLPYNDRALKNADAWLEMPTDAPRELADLVTSLAEKK